MKDYITFLNWPSEQEFCKWGYDYLTKRCRKREVVIKSELKEEIKTKNKTEGVKK